MKNTVIVLLALLVMASPVMASVSSSTPIDTALLSTITNPGEQKAAAAVNEIKTLSDAGDSTATAMVTQFNNFSGVQKKELLSQLDNDTAANLTGAVAGAGNTAFSGGMDSRVGEMRAAYLDLSGSPMGPAGPTAGSTGWSVWANYMYNNIDQDTRKGANGYDASTHGVILGVDKQIDRWLIGLSGGYAGTDVTAQGVDSESDIDTWNIGMYLSYTTQTWYVDGGLSYADGDIDTKRKLALLGVTAKGDTDSDTWSGYLNLGYRHAAGNWTLVPNVGLSYSDTDTDGYSEKGAGGWGQTFKDTDYDSCVSTVGLKADYAITNNIMGQLRGAWTHEFCDNQPSVKAKFNVAGATYRTYKGLEADDNAAVLGAGLTGRVNDFTTLYINYDLELKEDYAGQTVMAGARVEF